MRELCRLPIEVRNTNRRHIVWLKSRFEQNFEAPISLNYSTRITGDSGGINLGEHPVLELIGKIISKTFLSDCEVILEKDCCGTQDIQLDCNGQSSKASRYRKVDLVVLKNGQVEGTVEIAESDIRPAALLAKMFVSTLASHFVYGPETFRMAERVSFIQVIPTFLEAEPMY